MIFIDLNKRQDWFCILTSARMDNPMLVYKEIILLKQVVLIDMKGKVI